MTQTTKTLSELLAEAQDDIRDPNNWYGSGWAEEAGDITCADDLIAAGAVCAVTSVARAAAVYDRSVLDFSGGHSCNCEYCDEYEVVDLDTAMERFEHPGLDLLDEVARELYDKGVPDVNDDSSLGHEAVMRIYDLAIERARERERQEKE